MPTLIKPNAKFANFKNFSGKINSCLKLLDSKAGNYRKWMDSYNLTVRPYSKSGANFADNCIDLGLSTFNASETWLASVLIHETIHFWQYRTKIYKAGKPAETQANHYQLIVLKAIGGSKSEIAHLVSQTGEHADLNGDGVYDEKDYKLRNY